MTKTGSLLPHFDVGVVDTEFLFVVPFLVTGFPEAAQNVQAYDPNHAVCDTHRTLSSCTTVPSGLTLNE